MSIKSAILQQLILILQKYSHSAKMQEIRGGASLKKVGWTREGSEWKMGVWGLAPRKIFRTTPFRTSENALLKDGIKFVFIVDLM